MGVDFKAVAVQHQRLICACLLGLQSGDKPARVHMATTDNSIGERFMNRGGGWTGGGTTTVLVRRLRLVCACLLGL